MSPFPADAPLDNQIAYVGANIDKCTDDEIAGVIIQVRKRNANKAGGDAAQPAPPSAEEIARMRQELEACCRHFDAQVAQVLADAIPEGSVQ